MVMVIGVFVIPTPDEVSAASKDKEIKSGKTLKFKDSECVDKSGNAKTHYIKFKAGKTGYVTVRLTNGSSFSNYTAGNITLCNNKKKVIGETNEVWSTKFDDTEYFTRHYGVKKGQTYYFRVRAGAGFKIKAIMNEVKDQKNHSQKKAKKLDVKKTAKGVIIANDKTADWYKITVPANKRVRITVTAKTNGDNDYNGIKATLMKSNGKAWKNGAYCYASIMKSSDSCGYLRKDQYGNQYGIADKKGTYYIKVERVNKNSSGYYTVKWQTY